MKLLEYEAITTNSALTEDNNDHPGRSSGMNEKWVNSAITSKTRGVTGTLTKEDYGNVPYFNATAAGSLRMFLSPLPRNLSISFDLASENRRASFVVSLRVEKKVELNGPCVCMIEAGVVALASERGAVGSRC